MTTDVDHLHVKRIHLIHLVGFSYIDDFSYIEDLQFQ
jgi:hypothetical protein